MLGKGISGGNEAVVDVVVVGDEAVVKTGDGNGSELVVWVNKHISWFQGLHPRNKLTI